MVTYQDVLVIGSEDVHWSTLLDVAVRLAGRYSAHLVGLYLEAPAPVSAIVHSALVASAVAQTRIGAAGEGLSEARRNTSEWAHACFHRSTAHVLIPTEWRVSEGDPGECAVLHARCSDLVILGQGTPAVGGPLPAQVLLGSGRPILIVPTAGRFPTLGERIVIAWNGSREAARAVHDALPLLRAAAQVTVLTVDGGGGTVEAGPDIARHLAGHGIHVERRTEARGDMGIAPLLLSRLADWQADMLVMGGYGHSRMRESMLGGVTREILQTMTVPTLLSH